MEQVLSVVDPAHVEDLRTRYLHDFLLELVNAADDSKIMEVCTNLMITLHELSQGVVDSFHQTAMAILDLMECNSYLMA